MTKLGEIKLSSSPEESRTTVIEEVVYDVRQLWNTLGFWTIDIFSEDGDSLVTGVKLISGVFMLSQYSNISFDLFVDSVIDPTRFDIDSYIIEVHSK